MGWDERGLVALQAVKKAVEREGQSATGACSVLSSKPTAGRGTMVAIQESAMPEELSALKAEANCWWL